MKKASLYRIGFLSIENLEKKMFPIYKKSEMSSYCRKYRKGLPFIETSEISLYSEGVFLLQKNLDKCRETPGYFRTSQPREREREGIPKSSSLSRRTLFLCRKNPY